MRHLLMGCALLACSFLANAADASKVIENSTEGENNFFDCWRYSFVCPSGVAVANTRCYDTPGEALDAGLRAWDSICGTETEEEEAPE